MTRRLPRLVLAALALNAALLAGVLPAPSAVFGCSCAGPLQGAPIFSGDEDVVLLGRVGAGDGRGVFAFDVERWFRGGSDPVVRLQSGTIIFADGTGMTDTCGVEFETGQHLIIDAYVNEGMLGASICSPHADVDSREGRAMLAAAINTFGEGVVPGGPLPEVSDDAAIDLASVAILSVVALVVIVSAGVVSAVGRRERPTTPRP